MKLGKKIAILMLSIFIVSIVINIIVVFYELSHIKTQTLQYAADSFRIQLNNCLVAKKKVWLTNAIQIAKNPIIQKGMYENDRNTCIMLLNNYGNVFKEHTTFKNIRIHLITKDLLSFVKSWNTDNFGEKLSYSDVYKRVKESQKEIVSCEMEPGGVRLKGVFPVVYNKRFTGMVAFEGGLNSIKRTLKLNNIDFLYFLKNDYLYLAKKLKSKPKISGYTLSQKDFDKDFFSYVSKKLNRKKALKNFFFDEEYLSIAVKIKSFCDREVGLYIIGQKSKFVIDSFSKIKNIFYITLITSIFTFVILIFVLMIFLDKNFKQPINKIVKKFKELSEEKGDLTKRLPVNSKDEIGELSLYFNKFMDTLQDIISQISEYSNITASSSKETFNISQQINLNAKQTSDQARFIANLIGEINTNIHTVATAIEEMDSSIKEISQNTSRAAKSANLGVEAAVEVNNIVQELEQSSSKVGSVIKIITSITEQTNLLALNATIEAARAGEAGKGFAVVANEVKELAKETAKETDNITKNIMDNQEKSRAVIKSMDKINNIVRDIDDIANSIASAVEEQTAVTAEISRALSGVANNIEQSSSKVNTVVEIAQNTTNGVNEVVNASKKLTQIANQFKNLVENFQL